MGNVIGLGRKRPDGKKIAELRMQQGLPQKTLAGKADGMSERLLRDIERRNKPVSATYITAIATALGTTSDEITLLLPDETLNASASLLKLRAVRSASELYTLADRAGFYRWELKVIPSAATAEDMRQVMTILRRLVYGRRELDEFDALPFGEIPRLARLHELLEKLRANGVGLLAGSYVYPPELGGPDERMWEGAEVIICVYFVPSEVNEEVITLDLEGNFR